MSALHTSRWLQRPATIPFKYRSRLVSNNKNKQLNCYQIHIRYEYIVWPLLGIMWYHAIMMVSLLFFIISMIPDHVKSQNAVSAGTLLQPSNDMKQTGLMSLYDILKIGINPLSILYPLLVFIRCSNPHCEPAWGHSKPDQASVLYFFEAYVHQISRQTTGSKLSVPSLELDQVHLFWISIIPLLSIEFLWNFDSFCTMT